MENRPDNSAPPKKGFFASRRDVDMTSGGIVRHLILFAFPLLVGNLFQQLYNAVDTWVVGNFVSNEAFSAVGSVTPIVNMLIGTFLGLSSGAGVVISQYYGAKDEAGVSRAVHTSAMLTLILGALFTAAGLLMTSPMLRLMNCPENVFPQAKTYLTIYFSGIVGLMVYNMGAGVLRAIGDSLRPFLFLVVSALLNIGLDLAFVLGFGMGVDGVAFATILSQGVSALLVIAELMHTPACIKLSPRRLAVHLAELKKILRVGLPAAIQMAVTAFSNVFVQSYINYFQADCMSGWTAYLKIDQFMLLPMQSIALAATTFVGQNLGVGQEKRARRGADVALLISLAATAVLIVPILFFAPHLVAFFNAKPEVVTYGTLFLRCMSPCYLLCCVNQIYCGVLRGAGDGRGPMFMMVGSFVVFRQIYLYVMANCISNTVLPIAMSYPAGWLVCSVAVLIYYRRADLSRTRLTA